MSSFAPLRPLGIGRRPIVSRALILYRTAPADVAALLPAHKRPLVVQGKAVISLCHTRLAGLRDGWMQRMQLAPRVPQAQRPAPGSRSDHLACRVAVSDVAGGYRSWWAVRRATSSWLEARCGEKLRRCDYRHATFTLTEHPFGMELDVVSAEGQELYLKAEASPRLTGSLFGSAREARDFLEQTGGVQPPDLLCPESDALELGAFAPEPLVALDVRSSFVASFLASGEAPELDSAFRLVPRRVAPVLARSTSRLRVMLDPAHPALPSS